MKKTFSILIAAIMLMMALMPSGALAYSWSISNDPSKSELESEDAAASYASFLINTARNQGSSVSVSSIKSAYLTFASYGFTRLIAFDSTTEWWITPYSDGTLNVSDYSLGSKNAAEVFLDDSTYYETFIKVNVSKLTASSASSSSSSTASYSGSSSHNYVSNLPNNGNFTEFGVKLTCSPKIHNNSGYTTPSTFSASEVTNRMKGANYNSYGLYLRLDHSQLRKERNYTAKFYIDTPDGYHYYMGWGDCRLPQGQSYSYYNFLDITDTFKEIYEDKGYIPTGEYTLTYYFDDLYVNYCTFRVMS